MIIINFVNKEVELYNNEKVFLIKDIMKLYLYLSP